MTETAAETTKKHFSLYRGSVIEKVKKSHPCEEQFDLLLKARSFEELELVLRRNSYWVRNNTDIQLSANYKFPSFLDGFIDLENEDLRHINLPVSMTSFLCLSNTNVCGKRLPETVGNDIIAHRANFEGVVFPDSLYTSFFMQNSNCKNANFPKKVKLIDLNGSNICGATLPVNVDTYIDLQNCVVDEKTVFPFSVNKVVISKADFESGNVFKFLPTYLKENTIVRG